MAKQVNPGGGKRGTDEGSMPPAIKEYIDDQIQQSYKRQDDGAPHKKRWKYSWRSASPITRGTFTMAALVCVATIANSVLGRFQLESMNRAYGEMAKQTKTAQDTFSAVDRPYLGVNGITVRFARRDKSGNIIWEERLSKDDVAFSFTIEIKNFGSVPGEDFWNDSDAVIGGKKIGAQFDAATTGEVFPGQSVFFPGHAGPPYYADIMTKKSILDVRVHFRYSYAGRRYEHCETERFNPELGRFVSLGVNCPATIPR
jgi:hypothetical protein